MMVNLQYMDEINVSSNLKNIMMKLPYRLREKWRTTACELQERNGCRLRFIDMVDFIEHQVKILTDPLFGDIKDTQAPISHKAKVLWNFALQWLGTKFSYSGCSQHCWRFSV